MENKYLIKLILLKLKNQLLHIVYLFIHFKFYSIFFLLFSKIVDNKIISSNLKLCSS